MNYFPYHLGDYAAATTHLSWDEDMAYMRLLRLYYQTEKPIVAECEIIFRLVGAKIAHQKRAVENVLREFFTLKEDGYHQNRCDVEIERFFRKSAKAKESAEARWRREETHSERNANALPPQCEGNANQEPRTKNQKSQKLSEPNGSDGKPSKITDPAEIIFGYGVPLLTSAGSTDKHARSFLGGLRKQHGDAAVVDKLRECLKTRPLQPLEWLAAALMPAAMPQGKQGSLEARNAAVVASWVPPEMRGGE